MEKTKMNVSRIASEDILTTSGGPCESTANHFYSGDADGTYATGTLYSYMGFWQTSQITAVHTLATTNFDNYAVNTWYVWNGSKWSKDEDQVQTHVVGTPT